MAFQPQRFIHAANIRLDVPVSVQASDVLTDDLRLAFEDATLNSFDAVIDCCIARKVDYLLLSGNVFIEADRSLRARLALLKGFRKLAAEQIRVFVLPGDADPAEAWRSIPEMPNNVQICFSSSPEPVELVRGDRVVATIAASMWYGETDDFGIRVIAADRDGIQPFRIGVISQARYEEAQRMAAVASTTSEDLLSATLQNSANAENSDGDVRSLRGKLVSISDRPARRNQPSADLSDLEDEESMILPGVPSEGAHSGDHRTHTDPGNGSNDRTNQEEHDQNLRNWDSGFVAFIDEMLREGRLNYLALTGELECSSLQRPLGRVHCPGTTQPRSFQESSAGSCTLVEVSADGALLILSLDTSSIDWKDIEVHVASETTLSSMLQTMKSRLTAQNPGSADRIWSVHWTLRCSMPVLQELVHEDLAVAVAVELDELTLAGRKIRLLHNVELVPDAWSLPDEKCLAQRYSDIVNDSSSLRPEQLERLIGNDRELTAGWRQRLNSLIPDLNTEQVQARMRIDGAEWFIPDLSVLLPDTAGDNSEDRMSGEEMEEDFAQNRLEQIQAEHDLRHLSDESGSVYSDDSDEDENVFLVDDSDEQSTANENNGE